VWPISEEFCSFIFKNQELFHNRSVVELGAGAGLPSLFVAAFCKDVCLTDADEEVIDIMKYNINLNNCSNAIAKKLRWGDDKSFDTFKSEAHLAFDVVIGSDIFYSESHTLEILTTVKKLLVKGGLFILASTIRLREVIMSIHSCATKLGFQNVPVEFAMHNTQLNANFGFKIILMWKVPAIDQVNS